MANIQFSLSCIRNNNSDVLTTGISKSGKVTFTGTISSCTGVIKTVRGENGISRTDLSDQYLGIKTVVLVDEQTAAQIQEEVSNFILENNNDPRVSLIFSSNFSLPMPALGTLNGETTMSIIVQNAEYMGVSVYEEVLDESETLEVFDAAYQITAEKNRQAKENSFLARMNRMSGVVTKMAGLQAECVEEQTNSVQVRKVVKK